MVDDQIKLLHQDNPLIINSAFWLYAVYESPTIKYNNG